MVSRVLPRFQPIPISAVISLAVLVLAAEALTAVSDGESGETNAAAARAAAVSETASFFNIFIAVACPSDGFGRPPFKVGEAAPTDAAGKRVLIHFNITIFRGGFQE